MPRPALVAAVTVCVGSLVAGCDDCQHACQHQGEVYDRCWEEWTEHLGELYVYGCLEAPAVYDPDAGDHTWVQCADGGEYARTCNVLLDAGSGDRAIDDRALACEAALAEANRHLRFADEGDCCAILIDINYGSDLECW